MKKIVYLICVLLMTSSCSSLSNTAKGNLAGTFGGTILGAGLGGIIDGERGAYWGSYIGSTLGAVVGTAAGAEEDAKQAKAKAYAYAQQTNDDSQRIFVDRATGKKFERVTEVNDIVFQSRSSELDNASLNAIYQIAKQLKNCKSGIYIYGSTDNVESRDFEKELSEQRARIVAGYLLGLGVPADNMRIKGLGSESPIADNSTMDGRAMNRCVEIYVERN